MDFGLGAALGGIGGSFISGMFGARQADQMMDFQRNMANTQYQRAAKDLEAAGLNRILALGSPAATPTGAMAPTPDFASGATNALTGYAQYKVAKENEKLLRDQQANTQADTQKKIAEADYTKAQTFTTQADAILKNALTGLYSGQTSLIPFQRDQIKAGTAQSVAQERVTSAEASKQEVVKKLYEIANPVLDRLIEQYLTPLLNNAKEADMAPELSPNKRRGARHGRR